VSSPARTALEVRHAAAIKLVEAGELDGVLALSLVVWPRRGSRLEDDDVPRGKQFYRDELRVEIRKRHAAGETIPALALATGVPLCDREVLGQQRRPSQGRSEARAAPRRPPSTRSSTQRGRTNRYDTAKTLTR
jgi:hypothetical protein